MTKVDIFSGFLGAGKTTLIKKLLEEALKGEKLVLIENEFGDIGIDGGFLKESGIQINEMNSGCICCSLVGDFGRALEEVIREYEPDRILIEPSGVGKLSDVIRAVENIGDDRIALNSFTTVVDAKKCKMYSKNFGEFFNNQIENASTVVLSHTDKMEEKRVSECIALIRNLNDGAELITTSWESLTGKQILDILEKRNGVKCELEILNHEHAHHEGCSCHEHEHHEHAHHEGCSCHEHEPHDHEHHESCSCREHGHHDHEHHEGCSCHEHEHHDHEHHHHADDVFQSVGIETTHRFSEDDIRSKLEELSDFSEFGQVLRAKGIVEGENGWIHFDYVPGEIDVRQGSAAPVGMICVIGAGIEESRIREAFGLYSL